jgi:hypothetical protein
MNEAVGRYEWTGTDQDGVPRAGALETTPASLAALVRGCFAAGWAVLYVWDGDDRPAGGIGSPDGDPGRRDWWAPGHPGGDS